MHKINNTHYIIAVNLFAFKAYLSHLFFTTDLPQTQSGKLVKDARVFRNSKEISVIFLLYKVRIPLPYKKICSRGSLHAYEE